MSTSSTPVEGRPIPPTVSVIIPMRNEEDHAEKCVASLLQQTYPGDRYELIVVDGNSSDKSREIVQRLQKSHTNLRLLDNPEAIVPTSMNIGIRHAVGEIVVRADAHTFYPRDYIEGCVKYLEATGADNVGGPIRTVPAGEGFSAHLVAAVLSSRFGVGNSHFRTSTAEGYVDTVPFGTFRKELFDRIGLFNEQLLRNQDNEMNARIRKAGGKIFFTPALTTNYFASATFSKLLQQTFRNAQWHIFTMRQMRSALGIRHLLPAGFVIGLCALAGLALVRPIALFGLIAILLVYFLTAFSFALRAADTPFSIRMVMPVAFLAFHVCYGAGTLVGLRFAIVDPGTAPIR